MATWPETLPQRFLSGTYKETDRDLVVSFKTDIGAPMTRKRCDANIVPIAGEMLMSSSQKATHRTFWQTNCASAFNFPDPDDPVNSTISVVYLAPPEYSDAGCFVAGEMAWKVSIQLARVS